MNASELLLSARKIAESHVKSGSDLNDSIAKIASDQSLSKSQIERLVEETNKATFLDLLKKKGEQEFPVADYETIKSKIAPKIEKNASENLKFESLNYSTTNFKDQVGNAHILPIVKVAENNSLSEDDVAYVQALFKVAEDIWSNYNNLLDLEALGQKRYGNNYNDTALLTKIAFEHNDNEISQLQSIEDYIIKQGVILEVIYNKMEKVASALWGETNLARAALKAGGSPFNRAAKAAGAVVNLATKGAVGGVGAGIGGAAKLGLKGAAIAAPVALPFVAKHGVKNLNTVLTVGAEGSRAIQGAKNVARSHNFIGPGAMELEKAAGAEQLFTNPLVQGALKWGGRALNVSNAVGKVTKNAISTIGPGMTALASEGVNKEASFVTGLQHALEFVTPAVVFGASGPAGIFAGITAAAAKKLGGGIALTMNKKELENSFDTIMKNNPELAENRQQVRGYFDVVSRHAPTLAKDPLVAESIVKNMNAFGGVDYNTIRGLRETESLGKSTGSEKGLSGLTAMFGRS